MPRQCAKLQAQRKSNNPFCSKRKRKTSKSRKAIAVGLIESLKETDKGSWFAQESQWPEDLDAASSSTLSALTSSASKKKLHASKEAVLGKINAASIDSDSEPDSSDLEEEDDVGDSTFIKPSGNYIVNSANLQELLTDSAVCKACHNSLQIVEKAGSKHGIGAKWVFRCVNELCESRQSRKPFPISPMTGRQYNINCASVIGFRAIGKGRSAAAKCLSFLDLTPIHTWDKHTKLIEEKVIELTEVDFKQAVSQLKQFKRTTGDVAHCEDEELEETVMDVGASFDCSWSSRGWSARDGLVAAVSEDTGKVLDVAYLTRECPKCKGMEEKKSKGELSRMDYLSWYISHKPSCLLNHEGSAQSMESSGVLQLYRRSVEKHAICYSPFIGDGDCSSYSQVSIEQPYGPSVYIPKVECISHVTKRMGTNLRSLVRDYKGKKLADGKGLSGAGRLTLNRIDSIQSFYGLCIRKNKGDSKAMAKATKAIMYHYASTEENPQHDFCPAGTGSWCSYQRDIANSTHLHIPIKNSFPPAIIQVIKPIFDRLGDEHFLVGCEKCATQNPNESLHHVIWGLVHFPTRNQLGCWSRLLAFQ